MEREFDENSGRPGDHTHRPQDPPIGDELTATEDVDLPPGEYPPVDDI
ncbi:MAG TPA: hypothetical protein VE591_04025 [Candidatus Acidoferrum sp.]|nr:hypothetical protein [Candidatus Acidoferrum sp.]